mgnify:CR=1 FL=1
MQIEKRGGRSEELCPDKIMEVLGWACDGLSDVSAATVLMHSKLQFFEGMKSSQILETLVKSAADLINEYQPDYQYVAGRLLMTQLRKQSFGQHEVPDFYEHILELVGIGKYDKDITNLYSPKEISELGAHIDNEKDMNYTYAAMVQWESKYLIQDRTSGDIFESPQQAIMLIGMCLFQEYPRQTRLDWVKKFYDATSDQKISLPTPIMGGVRSPTRQFSSCCLIETADSLSSINAVSNAITRYSSMRAGIGINAGVIRRMGAPIRGGEAYHTGGLGFFKTFHAALKSCSQGGIRGGAGTLFFPWWHYDVESYLVLKNNKGTEDNRIRGLDYGVQFNKLFYQKALSDQTVNLFCPFEAEGLYDAFFADQDLFEELYNKYSADESIPRKTVKAKELLAIFVQERAGTGRVYLQNVDNCNNHGPFNPEHAPIKQSNLCVAPETQVMTKDGYVPIAELEGESLDVWNGFEWSNVDVVKTGEDKKLLKVTTTSGYELDCTPEHKFYIFNGYGKDYKEVRTHELKSGDKLMKFELPVIQGTKTLDKAYVNGFYSGDGCNTRQGQRIYLYHEKRKLKDLFFGGGKWTIQDEYNREYCHYRDLKEKFFVPSSDYTVESRLSWLAGYLDADGCIYRNGSNESITGSSVEKTFLQEVQLMLQTLGVSSKVVLVVEEGMKPLPANDGSGDKKDFLCKSVYRLLLSSYDSFRLLDLGLSFHRLEITKKRPQRDAKQFVKVDEVLDLGRISDTYCFTEPKRNLGLFNGILTGQCLEIALPTTPLSEDDKDEGEIALCTLAAYNLGTIDYDEIEGLGEIMVRALDALLDYQSYPVKAAEKSLGRRALGVGVINYAYYLAKNKLKYSDGSANELTHNLFEKIQFSLLKASNKLAKEQWACRKFKDTRYSEGLLPIDWYNKAVDNMSDAKLLCDWEGLRENIKKYGLRNSTLTALMPAETSALISNATNGIEPPRGLTTTKGSKHGMYKQVVPDVQELFNNYELLWDMKGNKGYLELVAIMQKFVDQSISANTKYNPFDYEGNLVPYSEMVSDIVTAFKYGVKTLYYHNTYDGSGEDNFVEKEEDCGSGACSI